MTVDEGLTYTASELADIRLSRNLEGKGFSGVVTSGFYCDIFSDHAIPEGAVVRFSGYPLPFTVAKQVYRNGVARIECYDACKNLDIPFDYSAYTQFDNNGKAKTYAAALITADIAHQCGFSGGGGYSGRIGELYYLDFAGKSCREILNDLSQAYCGYWYANLDNALVFNPFNPSGTAAEIAEENRSEIEISGIKTIKGIYAEDTVYGTEYSTHTNWQNTERMSGRYLSADIAADVAAQILSDSGEYTYYGWNCTDILTDTLYDIGNYIGYEGKNLPVLNADYRFTDMGIIAALGAAAPDNSFSEYHDLYSRRIERCIAYDKVLGTQYFSESGSGLFIIM